MATITDERPEPIIVTVRGGIVYVDNIPTYITVEIHDYDITDEADEDAIDEDGKAYSLQIL